MYFIGSRSVALSDGKYLEGKTMTVAQSLKNWLRKLFAWWPGKRSAAAENLSYANSLSHHSPREISAWSNREGSVSAYYPYDGRMSPIENMPPARQFDLAALPTPIMPRSEALTDGGELTPSTRQRLEFLRYLVQQGIVNEGFDDTSPPYR
jgi:hypothetical protein